VAIKGSTVVVGASREAGNGSDESNNSSWGAGAVYVFTHNGSVWSQQAYLKPTVVGGGDFFGQQVAITDGLIVVGAPDEDGGIAGINNDAADASATDSGAIYTFTGSGASWAQQVYINTSNIGANDNLGGDDASNAHVQSMLAVDGDTIVAGVPREDGSGTGPNNPTDDDNTTGSGAVYIFK
jgi:hypothetical protein